MTNDLGFLAPIQPDWTIAELVARLTDDARQHDPALRHPLALVEAAVTGARWTGEPSTVALIRSLAAAVREHGTERIGDCVRIAQMTSKHPDSGSFARFETDARTDRMPEPQVA